MAEYTVTLEEEDVGIVREALKIFRENWNDALLKRLAGDQSVTHLDPRRATEIVQRCEAILAKLPDRPFSY